MSLNNNNKNNNNSKISLADVNFPLKNMGINEQRSQLKILVISSLGLIYCTLMNVVQYETYFCKYRTANLSCLLFIVIFMHSCSTITNKGG